jgi:hypothetical protein
MKIGYILVGLCWLTILSNAKAQLLSGQAPAGTNTLLLPGSTIGLSLPKEGELSFSYYSKYRSRLFYGITTAAKNQEGLGKIFDAGQFSTAASLKGAIGVNWSWIKGYDQLERNRDNALQIAMNNGFVIDSLIRVKINEVRYDASLGTDAAVLADSLLLIYSSGSFEDTIDSFTTIADGQTSFSTKVSGVVRQLLKRILIIYALGATNRQGFTTSDSVFGLVKNKPLRDSRLFLFLRQSAAQYYVFKSLSSTTPVDSIQKQYYGRADFGIGFNHRQGGRLFLGVNYGWRRANTIPLMSKDDYSVKTVFGTAAQSVTKEKKLTAYKGVYQEFKQSFFYADILWIAFVTRSGQDRNFKPNKAAEQPKILLNPYFRLDISRDKDVFPTVATVGLSTLFRNRTGFLGGLYVEGYDLANNLEKFQAARKNEPPALTRLYNRLSFGIMTQFEILSIFN